MRKLWIVSSAIVAAIVLIMLAIPFGMGVWVQKRYPQVISQFNTPHVSFRLVNFKRGWFHSRAQLQITLQNAGIASSDEVTPLAQTTIVQNIQHGPLVRQKALDGTRRWVVARAALRNENHESNSSFEIDTLWTMVNKLSTRLNIQHLLLGNNQQGIEINQLMGTINFTPSDKHFLSQINLSNGALYGSNPERIDNDAVDLVKILELGHLTALIDIRKIQSLWYGNRHLEVQKITFFPYGDKALTADNFVIDLTQNQRGDLTDLTVTNQIEALSSSQFKIGQLQLALALKNMNTPLLENFARVLVYGTDFRHFKLYSLLVDLLAKGMAIELNRFQFISDDGPVLVQAQIASPQADAANTGLLHLLGSLNIQASADVPKDWLKKNLIAYYQRKKNEDPTLKIEPDLLAQNYIDHWLAHHVLMPKDKQVTMVVNYKGGQLLINGEKPSLDNFIQ